MTAFYERHGDGFRATEHTRGPWDVGFQHGGPPSALLARALAREGTFLARLSVELLRPVPITTLKVTVDDGAGRTVQRPTATLWAGEQPVARAAALRVLRAEQPEGLDRTLPPPWPAPDTLAPYRFTFFQHPVGYHTAIELRCAQGAWGRTPVGFWARPVVDLVEGTPTTPTEAIVLLADAQSGMGVPHDPLAYTFVNPDLHVFFERDPTPGWFGFDIRATAGPQGTGLAQSAVRDAEGLVARSIQTLLVRPRASR